MERAFGLTATPGLLKLSPYDIPLPSPNGILPVKTGAFTNPSNTLDNLAGKSAHVLVDGLNDRPGLTLSIDNILERRNVLIRFEASAVERLMEEKPDGQAAKLFRGKSATSFILYGRRLAEFLNELGIRVQRDGTVLVSSRYDLELRNNRREARITGSSTSEAERRRGPSRLTRPDQAKADVLGDYIFGSPPTIQPGTGAQLYRGVTVNRRNLFTTAAVNSDGTIDVQGAGALNHLVNTGGNIRLEANGGQNFIQNYGGNIQAFNEDGTMRLVNNNTYINSVNLGGSANVRFQGKSSSVTIENHEGLIDMTGTSDGASFFMRNNGEIRLVASEFSGIAVLENVQGSMDAELSGRGSYLELTNEGGSLLLAGSPPGATVSLRNGSGALSIVSAGPGGESVDVRNGSGTTEIRNDGAFERLAVDSEKGSLFLESLGAAGSIRISASSPQTRVITLFPRGDISIDNRGQRLVLTGRTRGSVSVMNEGSAHISTMLGSGDLAVENGKGKLRLDVGEGRGDVTVRNAWPRKIDIEIGARLGAVALDIAENGDFSLQAAGPFEMRLAKEGVPVTFEHGGKGALRVMNPTKLAALSVSRGVGDVLVEGDRIEAPAGTRIAVTKGTRGDAVEIAPA